MAALAHTLLGSPARCGLCRAINPKEDYKLCSWGGLAREYMPLESPFLGLVGGRMLPPLLKSPFPVTS
ncbi:hypothetical protein M0R45_036871 [Rubus argutus]|uniref:Uncharacterized protein n=1 Tax=Rubus argutus TaxID=59490 RepID=A0AAW1W2T4_RUBAR